MQHYYAASRSSRNALLPLSERNAVRISIVSLVISLAKSGSPSGVYGTGIGHPFQHHMVPVLKQVLQPQSWRTSYFSEHVSDTIRLKKVSLPKPGANRKLGGPTARDSTTN